MRSSLWLGAVVGLTSACTSPNPRSCFDGECSDPKLPFCDVDGAIAGSPKTCIAVSCTPEEVAVCRGSDAVTCNSTGDDYVLEDCPLGCDVAVGGCRTCATNDDCGAAAPICDVATSQCRTCSADSECSSTVCEVGVCVAEAEIVYASSNGSGTASCTLGQPCSIARAIVQASSGGTSMIIRLLPGAYGTPIDVLTATTLPLAFVASGVTISAPDIGVRVHGGATVRIRGLTVTGANQAVTCGSSTSPLTTLTIYESVVFDMMGSRASVIATECSLELIDVESRSVTGESNLVIATGTRFVGDRLYMHGSSSSITAFGRRVNITLTNSVLDNATINVNTSDTQIPGSTIELGFNTLVMEGGNSVACDLPNLFVGAVFENNIIVANGAAAAVTGTECSLINNVLWPQPSMGSNNIVADPQFVDEVARNFRLRMTSPALGAARSSPLIFTDHDFENRGRPQGSGADIGAYEQ